MMRIGFVAYWFFESVIPLAMHIKDLGNDVIVILVIPRTYIKANYGSVNCDVKLGFVDPESEVYKVIIEGKNLRLNDSELKILVVDPFSRRHTLLLWWTQFKLIYKLRRAKLDVVNVVGQQSFLKVLLKFINNNKLVATIHEVNVDRITKSSKNKQYINQLLKRRIRIIFHSKYVQVEFWKAFPDSKSNVQSAVIPFGLFLGMRFLDSIPLAIEKNIKPGYYIVLYYGFIHPYKGVEVLIQAARLLEKRQEKVQIVVAGKGKLSISRNDIPSNVLLINRFLKDKEICRLHEITNLTVCPYLEASQSGVPMTSFQFGRPVLATRTGAFPEYISEGQNGRLVDAGNVNELVNGILRFRSDDLVGKDWGKLINAIYSNPANAYNWNNISKRTINFYLS